MFWVRASLGPLVACALLACEVPLPEGAFTPEVDASVRDAGKSDARATIPTIPDSGRRVDSGSASGPGRDAGDEPEDSGDTPDPPDPLQMRLEGLAGRYLMRFDRYSTSSTGSGLTALEIRSRVSLLLIAQLAVVDGELTATERVCSQVFEHDCVRGCSRATTRLDQAVIDNFLLTRSYPRTYRLDEDGLVTGEPSILQLGYDDPEGTVLPTRSSDARVWDVTPGGVREGLLAQLTVETTLATVSCGMYAVANYGSSFSGQLEEVDGELRFPEMELSLDGSEGVRLGASTATCADQEDPSDVLERAAARMVRYGDELSDEVFWSCPSVAEFDAQLRPDPL